MFDPNPRAVAFIQMWVALSGVKCVLVPHPEGGTAEVRLADAGGQLLREEKFHSYELAYQAAMLWYREHMEK